MEIKAYTWEDIKEASKIEETFEHWAYDIINRIEWKDISRGSVFSEALGISEGRNVILRLKRNNDRIEWSSEIQIFTPLTTKPDVFKASGDGLCEEEAKRVAEYALLGLTCGLAIAGTLMTGKAL